MGSRLALTLVWIFFLLAAMGALESYVHAKTSEGKRYLVAEDRNELLPPILGLYGAYFAGILGFWFAKPFEPAKSESRSRARFLVAVLCTVIFNGAIVFILLEAYFSPGGRRDVGGDVETAKSLAKWLSFLVAPVNAYYFGTKGRG